MVTCAQLTRKQSSCPAMSTAAMLALSVVRLHSGHCSTHGNDDRSVSICAPRR